MNETQKYVKRLEDFYVKFWFNTVFNQAPESGMTISNEDFMVLAELALSIERGQ